jgi:hypothetical protein
MVTVAITRKKANLIRIKPSKDKSDGKSRRVKSSGVATLSIDSKDGKFQAHSPKQPATVAIAGRGGGASVTYSFFTSVMVERCCYEPGTKDENTRIRILC